jgi:hypothetical protein
MVKKAEIRVYDGGIKSKPGDAFGFFRNFLVQDGNSYPKQD